MMKVLNIEDFNLGGYTTKNLVELSTNINFKGGIGSIVVREPKEWFPQFKNKESLIVPYAYCNIYEENNFYSSAIVCAPDLWMVEKDGLLHFEFEHEPWVMSSTCEAVVDTFVDCDWDLSHRVNKECLYSRKAKQLSRKFDNRHYIFAFSWRYTENGNLDGFYNTIKEDDEKKIVLGWGLAPNFNFSVGYFSEPIGKGVVIRSKSSEK